MLQSTSLLRKHHQGLHGKLHLQVAESMKVLYLDVRGQNDSSYDYAVFTVG